MDITVPVIALVGRPNVGKSTLFNRLTRTRDALVANEPGLTRDRKFGEGKLGSAKYIVIDTGGLSDEGEGIDKEMATQSWEAVEQADMVFFLVDARDGLLPGDLSITKKLRSHNKQVFLIVNKIDGLDPDIVTAEFYSLGFSDLYYISAEHGRGVTSMIDMILADYVIDEDLEGEEEKERRIKVGIIGRPNVGKSTLVNRLLGEERVVTFDLPGTTRDSIFLPFERDEIKYTLIDTAGVRRRARVSEAIEKFSIIKTLQAIQASNVVIYLIDGQEGITEQDAHLLGFVLEAGRALIIAVNKWDGLDSDHRDQVKHEIDIKLPFVKFAEFFYISALHGSGVGNLFDTVKGVYDSAMSELSTPNLTRLLADIVAKHPPPLHKGRRIKLRYAHQGGKNPPTIVIHGNQTKSVPRHYLRYLENAFRKFLKLEGTPLRIECRSGDNPFEGKKNKLSKRQVYKRKRLMRHTKGK